MEEENKEKDQAAAFRADVRAKILEMSNGNLFNKTGATAGDIFDNTNDDEYKVTIDNTDHQMLQEDSIQKPVNKFDIIKKFKSVAMSVYYFFLFITYNIRFLPKLKKGDRSIILSLNKVKPSVLGEWSKKVKGAALYRLYELLWDEYPTHPIENLRVHINFYKTKK